MNVRSRLLALLVAAAPFAACSNSISGTGGTGGTGGAANCATCSADERCEVLEPCLYPKEPYLCWPCQHRPYCGADGKIYDSDCAAIHAGQKGGSGCAVPAGTYACGASYCNATNEDCGSFSNSACVPCATVTGRACGDDGNVYDSACALLQAGRRRGTMCPGFVSCGFDLCDTTTSTCVMGIVADCQGGTPVESCQPGVDAGG